MHHVNSAYDRWLLHSARSLAQEIKPEKMAWPLSIASLLHLKYLEWMTRDKTYFKITSASQGLLAGEATPRNANYRRRTTPGNSSVYQPLTTEPVRVVGMAITAKSYNPLGIFNVVVAETLNKRTNDVGYPFADSFLQTLLLLELASIY